MLKDLKEFRESSDYEDVEINIDKGTKALKNATELRKYIRGKFHV